MRGSLVLLSSIAIVANVAFAGEDKICSGKQLVKIGAPYISATLDLESHVRNELYNLGIVGDYSPGAGMAKFIGKVIVYGQTQGLLDYPPEFLPFAFPDSSDLKRLQQFTSMATLPKNRTCAKADENLKGLFNLTSNALNGVLDTYRAIGVNYSELNKKYPDMPSRLKLLPIFSSCFNLSAVPDPATPEAAFRWTSELAAQLKIGHLLGTPAATEQVVLAVASQENAMQSCDAMKAEAARVAELVRNQEATIINAMDQWMKPTN